MTKKDLEQYQKLHDEFVSECKRVAKILSNLEDSYPFDNTAFAETFEPAGVEVSWAGYDTCRGETDYYNGYFPIEYLTMTDDELNKIVEKKNKQWEAEQERREKAKAAQEKEWRKAKYEELKKEFGD